MRLHDGHLYLVEKRVNGGHWMSYTDTRADLETAEKIARTAEAYHRERCPKDDVEFKIRQVY